MEVIQNTKVQKSILHHLNENRFIVIYSSVHLVFNEYKLLKQSLLSIAVKYKLIKVNKIIVKNSPLI